jgi:hypothetical protein
VPGAQREPVPGKYPASPILRTRSHGKDEGAPGTGVHGSTATDEELGDGGPPPPPPDEVASCRLVVWLRAAIHSAGARATKIRYRVVVILVFLAALAAAALVAGVLAKNDTFWAASAFGFTAAFCALIAYSAKELGVFAETAELLSRAGAEGARSAEPAGSFAGGPSKEALRAEVRGEIASEVALQVRGLRHHDELFTSPVDPAAAEATVASLLKLEETIS